MAWSNSKIFRPFLADALDNTAALDLGSDTITFALYDNSITPNQDVTSAASAYGAGVWSTTGGQTGSPQVYHTGQWAQGGVNLTTNTVNSGTAGVVFFTADNPESGTTATMSSIYGVLCYDNTLTTPVADQGICFNYFGAPVAVSSGKLTATIPANGIFRFTL